MTEYAVRESDGTMIRDGSWACVSDVVGSFHGGFAQDGRVTGVLLSRESPDEEWREVSEWADERADILARFTAELAKVTGDGSRKRQAGTKPPWYEDDSHEGAVFSHITKWKRGELVDPDSGCHPNVHAAWRLLAIACRESGNVPHST